MSRFVVLWLGSILLLGSCLSKTRNRLSSAPKVKPQPTLAVAQQKVSALGIATGMGLHVRHLARQVAQNKALRELASLLQLDGLLFEYRAAGDVSVLRTKLKPLTVPAAQTDFEFQGNDIICKATVTRPPKIVAAMEKLYGVQASAKVAHADRSSALLLAKSRALRRALAQTLQLSKSQAVHVAGSITVLSIKQQLMPQEAKVTLRVNVKVIQQRPLSTEEKVGLFVIAAKEHRQLREWELALLAQKRAVDLDPQRPEHWARLGGISLDADKPQEAAKAFLQASVLAPERVEFLEAAILAYKRVPDLKSAAKIEKKIKKLRGN